MYKVKVTLRGGRFGDCTSYCKVDGEVLTFNDETAAAGYARSHERWYNGQEHRNGYVVCEVVPTEDRQ